MNEVALKIGGRTYRVACAPGDEDRVSRLGATIAEKLASIGNPSGPDAQNLLLAALLLADEVQDGRDAQTGAGAPAADSGQDDAATGVDDGLTARIADLEAELAQAKSAASDAADEVRNALARQAELQQTVSAHEIAAEDMRGEIAGLRNAHAAAPAGRAGGEDLASLAPALERLAEMLEDCADKLESRPASA
jgi:cell division protein ZapA